MKKRNFVRFMLMMCLVGSMPIKANTLEQLSTLQINEHALYMDTSELNLPYVLIPGFLISPLQVPGELLAPFSQERVGYNHAGMDIRTVEGTPVFAIADGVVTKAAPDSKGVENGGGHMIFVDFGKGTEGRYMHLSAYGVKAGDKVKAGQVIGFTGNTGDSSAPHLHFEYRSNGVAIDPAFIFEASGIIAKQMPSTQIDAVGDTIVNDKEIVKESEKNKLFFVVQK